jgi:CheY-like chemotaxis protein
MAFQKQEITILLVEDDPGHARLIEKNLRRANIMNPIVPFQDGQSVIDFLASEEAKALAGAGRPLLILLDLNIPVLDGYQVLERLKAGEWSKRIPVVVLTTTDEPREVSHCYRLGCNVFVTKPVDYNQFSEAIRRLGLFLSVVKIPGDG